MAETNEVNADRRLNDLFKEGYKLYCEFETTSAPSNSAEYQANVQNCIKVFEDSTRLVNLVGMFSANEMIEEVATDHLKYILLPFFLGQLNVKVHGNKRQEVLQKAEIYYKDFLKRCEDYGICGSTKLKTSVENDSLADLVKLADKRNEKLEMYKKKKELDEQIKMLKIAVEKENVDEDIKRGFYIKLLRSSAIEAKQELESTQQEMEILEYSKMRQSDEKNEDKTKTRLTYPPTEPLKPFVIHGSVFGKGYPSLPTMTVADFYDQRVREGIFPDPEKVDMAGQNKNFGLATEEEEELETEKKESLIEKDDEEYLGRLRAMDEFHDVVRRGDGNRYNKS